ncbi:2OG-Fe(II) oxygenase [Muricoccus aerilatus]|uniref:2OG-Fe(II) oxygenase n=1 Tax=Muricoccus aerilatus TaxID=452982 RepID=UPI000694BB32|nr:2OG-Fe(II) oxygenase [Roseomonas aerilata]
MSDAEAPPRPSRVLPLERFRPGDPVPVFRAATDGNPRYAFDSVAGRYVLLAFLGSRSHPASASGWEALRRARAAGLLDDARACAFAVTADPGDAAPAMADALPGLRVIRDHDLAVSRAYAAFVPAPAGERPGYAPFALLLDPLLRVLDSAPIAEIGRLVGVLEGLPAPGLHAGMEVPAPVLVLPRVLEPGFCRELVALYDRVGGNESGFMREVDGRTVPMLDAYHKRRKDLTIEDEGVRAALRERLTRRLVPEIHRAFQFRATRIERYIVACYDAADGGHFRAHRDNTTRGTAHRRFAVSINLNDDFDGGDLWFPEFGTRRYRPPMGGAVVFSCSLLHEAGRVTRGVRYATLPFLYDEAAAKVREEGRRFIGAAGEEAAAEG